MVGSNKLKLLFIIAVGLVIILFLPNKTVAPDYPLPEPEIITEPVEVEITPKIFLAQEVDAQGLEFRDLVILYNIIFCESSWSQYWSDGTVKVSNGNVGLFQINIGAHKVEYTELGLDPYDEFDNISYGLILYKRNGIRDWEQWSGHCFIPKLKAKGIEL